MRGVDGHGFFYERAPKPNRVCPLEKLGFGRGISSFRKKAHDALNPTYMVLADRETQRWYQYNFAFLVPSRFKCFKIEEEGK